MLSEDTDLENSNDAAYNKATPPPTTPPPTTPPATTESPANQSSEAAKLPPQATADDAALPDSQPASGCTQLSDTTPKLSPVQQPDPQDKQVDHQCIISTSSVHHQYIVSLNSRSMLL